MPAAAWLRELIPALRDGELDLVSTRAREALPGRGEVFEATLRERENGRVETRPLLLERGGPQAPGPLARWSGHDVRSGVSAWLSPADPWMSHVDEIVETERLRALCAAQFPRLALGRLRMRVLAHRFGRRITLHLRIGAAEPSGRATAPLDLVLKVFAGGGHARLAGTIARLNALPELPFAVPRPLRHEPARRLLLLEHLPGESLHERLAAAPPARFAEAGEAIRRFQRLEARGLSPHDGDSEAAVLVRARERAATADASFAALMRGLEENLTARLRADVPPRGLVPAHRDFYDKQLLLRERGLGVLDWESASLAPPALDPGNFLAHLRLRALQGVLGEESRDERSAAFLAGYAPEPAGEELRAIHLWECASLLRLAGVYRLRPGCEELARELLRSAAETWRRTS